MNMRVSKGRAARVTLERFPWDIGPVTANQMQGKVAEPVMTLCPDTGKASNPNKVVRTRREAWIDRYARQGKLTAQQFNIARELFEAHEGRRQRDVLAALRIDQGRGHDPEAERMDRRRKFFAMWELVPVFARPVIEHVVLRDQSIRSMPGCHSGAREAVHLDRFQRGLEALHEVWR